MQCPDCGYICFKPTKVCGSCGFNFKKAGTSGASLLRNDSFTIFAQPKTQAKDQESSVAGNEKIAVMDPPAEGSKESTKSEDFLLDLSDTEQGSSALESSTSKPDNAEFNPMEFDADINLEEVEVEGLGLGLEPDESSEPAAAEMDNEETSLEINVAPDDSPIEIAVEETPVVEIAPSTENEITELEINDLSEVSLENTETIELTPAQSPEPEAPVLDLGGDDLSEPDEGPKVENELLQIDELNLEIDDSDGPLATTNEEIPEIEIEDLGLELEDPDSSAPEKP